MSASQSTCFSIGIKDLKDVLNATIDVSSKWDMMLLNLDINDVTIKRIRAGLTGHNVEDCYYEGLSRWLKKRERSWIDVVNALLSPSVRRNDLANEIIIKYNIPQHLLTWPYEPQPQIKSQSVMTPLPEHRSPSAPVQSPEKFRIGIKDLKDVLNATIDVSSKWDIMLLNLELYDDAIKQIRAGPNNYSIGDCYYEGLSEWLNQGERSWIDIVNALLSPSVRRKDLANRIIDKYNIPQSTKWSPEPQQSNCQTLPKPQPQPGPQLQSETQQLSELQPVSPQPQQLAENQPLLETENNNSVAVLPRNWTAVTDTETKKSVYQSKTGTKETLSTPPGYPLHQTRDVPGVTFYDKPQEKQFTSTGGHADFENGLEVSVPVNGVTPGCTVGIKVQAGFAPTNTFLLPDGIQSASPSYLISPEGCGLNGEVTLTMEHHVKVSTREEADELVFLQAESSPKILNAKSVYQFQEVPETRSEFIVGENKGKVSKKLLKKRFLKVGHKLKNFFRVSDKHDGSQPDPPESTAPDRNLYTVRVYRSPIDTISDRIAIIGVCLYGRLYAKLLETFDKEVIPWEYPEVSSKSVDRTTLISLSFVEMAVKLNIQPVQGWSVEPDRELIAKSEVDQPEIANFKPEDLHDYPPRIICRFFPEENALKRATCTIFLSGLAPEESCKVHVPLKISVSPLKSVITVDTSKLQEAAKQLRNTALQGVGDTQLGLTMKSVLSLMERMTAAIRSSSLSDLVDHTQSIRKDIASILQVAGSVAEECTRETICENIKASLAKLEPLCTQLNHVARVRLKYCQDPSAAFVDLVECGAGLLATLDCLLRDIQTLRGLNGGAEGYLTVEALKKRTRVTDIQLDTEIIEQDLQPLAGCFENVDTYLYQLGLSAGQQTDIKDHTFHHGTQSAMREALRLWRKPNPYAATFRALINITLELREGVVADKLCKYIADNIMVQQYSYCKNVKPTLV